MIWLHFSASAFSFSITLFKKDYYFPSKLWWHPCQVSIAHKYMGVFLGLQFYIYPYASTVVFDYCSFSVTLEIGKCESSNFVGGFFTSEPPWIPFQWFWDQMQSNQFRPVPHALHKYQIKIDHRLKCKSWNNTFVRRKPKSKSSWL